MYRQLTYIWHMKTRERKTQLISFRATSSFKNALKVLATRERRSQANLLEKLLFDYLQNSKDQKSARVRAQKRHESKAENKVGRPT